MALVFPKVQTVVQRASAQAGQRVSVQEAKRVVAQEAKQVSVPAPDLDDQERTRKVLEFPTVQSAVQLASGPAVEQVSAQVVGQASGSEAQLASG